MVDVMEPTANGLGSSADFEAQYVSSFVDRWDSLIDWTRRAQGESGFFVDTLKRFGARHILDAATGTGYHSVSLLDAGFDVVSVDGSGAMLQRAFRNGADRGHVLRTIKTDWRDLGRAIDRRFDAVVCLGSSFPHLFSDAARRKTLAEFYAALKHDGVLILDQRNFDAILQKRYKSSGNYYYCGQSANVSVDHADDSLVRFKYNFADGDHYCLEVFPLKLEETRKLLFDAGFQKVTTYGDFKEDFDIYGTDFIIHVAEKIAS